MQGIFPILVTPFDRLERIDTDSLCSLVDYTIDAGVHGLGIALGSEILKLTESERDLVISTVVNHVRGRVPVVVEHRRASQRDRGVLQSAGRGAGRLAR